MLKPPRSLPCIVEAISTSGCHGLRKAGVRPANTRVGDLAILTDWGNPRYEGDSHYLLIHLRDGEAIYCRQRWANFYSFWRVVDRELTDAEKLLAVKEMLNA